MSETVTNERRIVVGSSPHITSPATCTGIMLWVVAALLPTTIWACITMGWPAIRLIVLCLVATLGTEALWNAAARKRQTLTDGSALVTGLLLALSLPPLTPWWIALAAGIIAIALGKLVFGGLGFNIFNPALVGRAFVAISWAGVFAEAPNRGWFRALPELTAEGYDAVQGATRLMAAAADRAADGAYGFDLAAQYRPLLLLNLEGSLGEVSALLLLLGGAILLAKRIIDWRIPAGYIGTMALLSWVFGSDPLFNVLAGGLLLGAFFMATDYVSSPMTKNGRLLYGVGCGVFNAVGRFYGSMPEATTFAILFMNGLAPLIDRAFRPRTFGWVKRNG